MFEPSILCIGELIQSQYATLITHPPATLHAAPSVPAAPVYPLNFRVWLGARVSPLRHPLDFPGVSYSRLPL